MSTPKIKSEPSRAIALEDILPLIPGDIPPTEATNLASQILNLLTPLARIDGVNSVSRRDIQALIKKVAGAEAQELRDQQKELPSSEVTADTARLPFDGSTISAEILELALLYQILDKKIVEILRILIEKMAHYDHQMFDILCEQHRSMTDCIVLAGAAFKGHKPSDIMAVAAAGFSGSLTGFAPHEVIKIIKESADRKDPLYSELIGGKPEKLAAALYDSRFGNASSMRDISASDDRRQQFVTDFSKHFKSDLNFFAPYFNTAPVPSMAKGPDRGPLSITPELKIFGKLLEPAGAPKNEPLLTG